MQIIKKKLKFNKTKTHVKQKWIVKLNDVYFLISFDDLRVGDDFLFLAPDNFDFVLDRNTFFKYNKVQHAKVIWYYNKFNIDLGNILYTNNHQPAL